MSMDETIERTVNTEVETVNESELAQRDENRSPTSGSSSETAQENGKGAEHVIRKHRRHSKSKRKRKWKPYTELSWDERKIQDDRETKRAFAKRERMSAEGHPIAPYNTTQFLMEDHKLETTRENEAIQSENNSPNPYNSPNLLQISGGKIQSAVNSNEQWPVTNGKVVTDESIAKSIKKADSSDQDDIQRYILQDFRHTYAECHADQLQSLTKTELVTECLKLEKKVSFKTL